MAARLAVGTVVVCLLLELCPALPPELTGVAARSPELDWGHAPDSQRKARSKSPPDTVEKSESPSEDDKDELSDSPSSSDKVTDTESEDLNELSDSPSESDMVISDSPSADDKDELSDSPSESDNVGEPSDTNSDDKDELSSSPSESDKVQEPSDTDSDDKDEFSDSPSESDFVDQADFVCGFPGTPMNGRAHPDKTLYEEGEIVSYVCTSGAVVVGHTTRRCERDGSWTGQVPICDRSICPQGKASVSYGVADFPASLAIDGDLSTCALTSLRWPRWWRLDFGRPMDVLSVGVTKSNAESTRHKFSIYLIEVEGTKPIYHKCASFSGRFSSSTMVLHCDEGKGVTGRILHIEDKRDTSDEFDICEVEMFVQKSQYECGEPDRLPFSAVRRNSTQAEYSCQRGFRLEGGDTVRSCRPDGRWSGVPAVCREVTCQIPAVFENGNFEVSRRMNQGSKATYRCKPGFNLVGKPHRICGHDGEWKGKAPVCVKGAPDNHTAEDPSTTQDGAVCQGPPPTYYIAHNSSVAVLHCPHHLPVHGNPVAVCGPDGKWEVSNATCLYPGDDPLDTRPRIIFTESVLVAAMCAGIVALLLTLTVFFWWEEGGNEEEEPVRKSSEDVVPIIQVDPDPPIRPARPQRLAPSPPETRNHVYDTPKPIEVADKPEDPLYAKVDLERKRRDKLLKQGSSEEQKDAPAQNLEVNATPKEDETSEPQHNKEEKPKKRVASPKREKSESPEARPKIERKETPKRTRKRPTSPQQSEETSENLNESPRFTRSRPESPRDTPSPAAKKESPNTSRKRPNSPKNIEPENEPEKIEKPKNAEEESDTPKKSRRRPLSPKISDENQDLIPKSDENAPKDDSLLKRPPRQRRNF